MPITYLRDDERRRIVVTTIGSVGIDEMLAVVDRQAAESTWLYRVSLNTAVRWSRKEHKHIPSASLEQVAHVLQERPAQADERLAWLYEQIQRLD